MVSGEPDPALPVPAAVRAVAGAEVVRPAWVNERGGRTFQVGAGGHRRFVKWSPCGGIDLRPEVARLTWAAGYASVPRVLDSGSDDEGQWLVTAGLPGENAVTARWRANPAVAVTVIGRALRSLHDRAPVASCPFDWSLDDRLARVPAELHPADWHAEHRSLTVPDALARLGDPPAVDQLVVCHGDSCAPNTLIDDDGRCSGLVDLGALGVADRWADLAVATWSSQWNYGPGWERPLLDAYGIDPDPVRTAYYRLVWDLTP